MENKSELPVDPTNKLPSTMAETLIISSSSDEMEEMITNEKRSTAYALLSSDSESNSNDEPLSTVAHKLTAKELNANSKKVIIGHFQIHITNQMHKRILSDFFV